MTVKVRDVIAALQAQHDLDDEIMVMWSGPAFRELEHGLWEKCVQVFDDYPPLIEWDSYIDFLIADVTSLMQERHREEV